MRQERKEINVLEGKSWKPLSLYIKESVLEVLGLPMSKPTKSLVIFKANEQQVLVKSSEVHIYVGTQMVNENNRYKGGLPVIIFEKANRLRWYLNGVEGNHPDNCSQSEQQKFFTRARQLINPENEWSPYAFQFLVPELVKNIKE